MSHETSIDETGKVLTLTDVDDPSVSVVFSRNYSADQQADDYWGTVTRRDPLYVAAGADYGTGFLYASKVIGSFTLDDTRALRDYLSDLLDQYKDEPDDSDTIYGVEF